MEHQETGGVLFRRIIVGGAVLLAVGVLLDLKPLNIGRLPFFGDRRSFTADCQGTTQTNATVSNQQLAQFLSVPEGAPKQKVRDIVKDPYCQLSALQVRAGATAQREAYRLHSDKPQSSDSDAWLIVLYEGDQYTGYRIAK